MCVRALILSATCVLLTACYSEKSYIGDGLLVDRGFQLKGGRYSVELGKVSLSKNGVYKFDFSNLPNGYVFTAGVQFAENISLVEDNDTKISFVLLSDGSEVLSVSKEVRKWVLSHAPSQDGVFAYIRGDRENSRSNCVGGTYFHPSKTQKYQLIVEITSNGENRIETAVVQISDAGESRGCTSQETE